MLTPCKIQFNLLCEQSCANVWRKQAWRTLSEHYAHAASGNAATRAHEDQTGGPLGLLLTA